MSVINEVIEQAWENRELLKEKATQDAIREVIELLDKGKLRVAKQSGDKWLPYSADGNH
jgi:2,3,4,5-tetrahydropyridine-2-carboxylate N-succinyltransferase